MVVLMVLVTEGEAVVAEVVGSRLFVVPVAKDKDYSLYRHFISLFRSYTKLLS